MSENTKPNAFTQLIQYRALKLKHGFGGGVYTDMALDSESGDKIAAQLKLKNVCAKLPEELAEELDKAVSFLGLSKREFIQFAIIEALERTSAIVEDVDLSECLTEGM